jgi:hypothetical protein
MTASPITLHRIPRRACTWMSGRKIVATARYVGRKSWLLKIEGHQWPITADMPVARFLRIPGNGMTHTTVKGFPTWQRCAVEVERVLGTVDRR